MHPDLRPLLDKVTSGTRITEADAIALFENPDLEGIGAIADAVRKRLNGDTATYIRNRYINYSNICILSCAFCAFGARKRDAHAFESSISEILSTLRADIAAGITEVHMVGGLHPSLPSEWYLELLRGIRSLDANLHIKAFTAVEIRHLAGRIFKVPISEMLEILRSNGLNALTGGGAEIFDPIAREKICKGKDTADEWAEVHRTWHGMGQKSTCTMLYGHIETTAQRVDHLRRLRRIQDETNGFSGFIPFAFEPEGARPALKAIPHSTADDMLRTLAVSRIYLDNIRHITAYWVSMGLPLAQLALNYGADDLHGTIVEERIFHMAGASTPQAQSNLALEKAIISAGRKPVQRNTFYEPLFAKNTN
jgi:aminodeoxyfutalosine synthase